MLPPPNSSFSRAEGMPQNFAGAFPPPQQRAQQMQAGAVYHQPPGINNAAISSTPTMHQFYAASTQAQNTRAPSFANGRMQMQVAPAQRHLDQGMSYQRPQGIAQYTVVTNSPGQNQLNQHFPPQQQNFPALLQTGQFQSNVIQQQQMQQNAVQIRMVATTSANAQQLQQIGQINQGQQIIYQQQPHQIITNVGSLQRLLAPNQLQIQTQQQQQVLINVPRQSSAVGGFGVPQQQQQYIVQHQPQQQQPSPQRQHPQQHHQHSNIPGVAIQAAPPQNFANALQQAYGSGTGTASISGAAHNNLSSAPSSSGPQLSQSSSTSTALFSQQSNDLDLSNIAMPPLLTKQRLDDLVREVDPFEQLDDDVKDALLQYADDFVENIATSACQVAKHRKSNILEAKDVQLTLERNWNMWIPGFGTDEPKPHKKLCVTEAHKQRMALIKKTLRKI